MTYLHVLHRRLMQLKPVPAEHHRKRQVHFNVREIDAQTSARAATKRYPEAIQRDTIVSLRVVEPALRDEFSGRGEYRFIVGYFGDSH